MDETAHVGDPAPAEPEELTERADKNATAPSSRSSTEDTSPEPTPSPPDPGPRPVEPPASEPSRAEPLEAPGVAEAAVAPAPIAEPAVAGPVAGLSAPVIAQAGDRPAEVVPDENLGAQPTPERAEAPAELVFPVAPGIEAAEPEPGRYGVDAEADEPKPGAASLEARPSHELPQREPPPPQPLEAAAGPAEPWAPVASAAPWTPSVEAAPELLPRETPQRPMPAWLLPSPPSTDALGQYLPYLRLALRGAAALAAGLVAIVLVLVVLYRWVNPPISTLMLGQSLAGTPIERTWVPLERISPHLVKAVILSEDGGFCRHRGVDWSALEEAMESARGGSTITMQVVKNLFLWPSRSYVRKAIEIGLAYLVEAVWPKRRIIEIYLNIAEWGDGVFGVEAAARAHFDKPASRLTPAEAALLAVALPNPIERTAGAPSLGTGRLASRLLGRMAASRADLSCVPVRRRAPKQAPLVQRP